MKFAFLETQGVGAGSGCHNNIAVAGWVWPLGEKTLYMNMDTKSKLSLDEHCCGYNVTRNS